MNCIGSRARHHDGRVTVHGIGNTRTSAVLQLLSHSVLCITIPSILVKVMMSCFAKGT